jgi:hypothetical protein
VIFHFYVRLVFGSCFILQVLFQETKHGFVILAKFRARWTTPLPESMLFGFSGDRTTVSETLGPPEKMKIMILSPGRTSAVGSRAREWTVQIIS